MRFALLLLPLAAAAPLQTRAANLAGKLVAALGTLSSDLATLNGSINALTPNNPLNAVTALQIQQQSQNINSAISNATSIAKASAHWNQADSLKVAQTVLNLQPSIYSVLRNIVVHKPEFSGVLLGIGDLSQTVEKNLVQQQSLSDQLGTAVAAKLVKALHSAAQSTAKQIHNHFQKAINAYKACTGIVCVPPFPSSG